MYRAIYDETFTTHGVIAVTSAGQNDRRSYRSAVHRGRMHHPGDTVGFEKRAYTLVYEWRKCDITMPATATSAIATAASADADADGFSAAYLRSCRHQYCGAGVLLLSRDRRKPQKRTSHRIPEQPAACLRYHSAIWRVEEQTVDF